MCPRTSCPLSSWTLNIVFGRASTISPSISIFSSLGTAGRRSDRADVHRLGSLVARLLLVLDLRVLGRRLSCPGGRPRPARAHRRPRVSDPPAAGADRRRSGG